MRQQQVNLLAPMFRKQQALFSSRVTLAMCVVVAGALALIYAASAWRGAALTAEQARLSQQRDTVTRQLNELAAQMQGRGRNQSLDAELATLTADRDRKSQALAALSRHELGNTNGFSPQFIGLARQRLNGLWLTRIEVGSNQIALDGVTLSEELIPRYLQKLGSEAIFAGTEFAHASLSRAHEGGNQLEFELRTRGSTAVAGGAP